MTGPYSSSTNNSEVPENKLTDETANISNQILGYLFGFSPTLEVDDSKAAKKAKEDEESKSKEPVAQEGPKVNSRDAKLHFLMGRYNSN